MTPQEIIGKRVERASKLKQLRLRKRLSKSKLSELTGLARETIGKIENGLDCWNIDSEIIYIEGCRTKKPR